MYYPYDRTHSTKLDCVIWLLEHEPRRLVRWLLRCYKRALESAVTR